MSAVVLLIFIRKTLIYCDVSRPSKNYCADVLGRRRRPAYCRCVSKRTVFSDVFVYFWAARCRRRICSRARCSHPRCKSLGLASRRILSESSADRRNCHLRYATRVPLSVFPWSLCTRAPFWRGDGARDWRVLGRIFWFWNHGRFKNLILRILRRVGIIVLLTTYLYCTVFRTQNTDWGKILFKNIQRIYISNI